VALRSTTGRGLWDPRHANPGKKAESHGCVRLTNWDAERLAKLVKKGTPVAFI
jgi:lipoprotein-anchoring transpeptidase ErfK/SrfK